MGSHMYMTNGKSFAQQFVIPHFISHTYDFFLWIVFFPNTPFSSSEFFSKPNMLFKKATIGNIAQYRVQATPIIKSIGKLDRNRRQKDGATSTKAVGSLLKFVVIYKRKE